MRLALETFVVPPFAENAYLLGDLDAGAAIAVDPGGRADEIAARAERLGLRIEAIVNTHAHIDHVAGVAALQRRTGAPWWLHGDAVPGLAQLPAQAALFGLPPVEVPAVDGLLAVGQAIEVGGLTLDVRSTPGHAPGHVTLVTRGSVVVDGVPSGLALCGDVIFAGSIGRVDLPGGDAAALMDSIEREILALPDDTVLCSGHGPRTTVGRERRANPFVLAWRRGERFA